MRNQPRYVAAAPALTKAPVVERVGDLARGWRHVATRIGTETRWLGDLTERGERKAYLLGVESGRVVVVQHRLGEGHYLVFAKFSAVEPKRERVPLPASSLRRG